MCPKNLYSYLNYNSINPHRIAAKKIIKFFASHLKDSSLHRNPGKIKYLKYDVLRSLSKLHFENIFTRFQISVNMKWDFTPLDEI